jgi:alkylation response protein AidB-like acyl-CoA dehydrogenase
MTTLSHERAGVARFHLVLRSKLDALLAEPAARVALRDRRLRQRIAQIWSQIACMRWTTERSLTQLGPGPSGQGHGQPVPGGTAGSLAKLAWSRADQALAELATDLLGLGALSGEWAYNLASSRSTSIAGGTSEINRNIVAEQGLGLPRG